MDAKQEKRERDERTNASKRQIDHEGHHNGEILFVLRPYYFFPLNRMIDRMQKKKFALFEFNHKKHVSYLGLYRKYNAYYLKARELDIDILKICALKVL